MSCFSMYIAVNYLFLLFVIVFIFIYNNSSMRFTDF